MTDLPPIVEPIENDTGDLEWFAEHPGREYRARIATAAELARKKNYPGDGDALEDDRFGYALVRLMPPGHVVIFYIGIAAPETEPDEANIARLWKIAFEEAVKFATTGLPPGVNMRSFLDS
jgi:hypothetical protein